MLIVISGPSGAGKGTVLKEVFLHDRNLHYSVSATTREPRDGEIDGINYFFKTKEQFENMVENNQLLEWTKYCKNYYGTPKNAVDELLDEGKDVVLEIEVDGAMQVKNQRPDCILVFIMPPSIEVLIDRLVGRDTETDEEIKRRIQKAAKEIEQVAKYNYVIVNDKVKQAANELLSVIKCEREKNK
jgi:guanylate kinase